jgi:hypothetical protein
VELMLGPLLAAILAGVLALAISLYVVFFLTVVAQGGLDCHQNDACNTGARWLVLVVGTLVSLALAGASARSVWRAFRIDYTRTRRSSQPGDDD